MSLLKSGICHSKKEEKKFSNGVLSHLESFKAHLFLGDKKGGTPILQMFRSIFHFRWEQETNFVVRSA